MNQYISDLSAQFIHASNIETPKDRAIKIARDLPEALRLMDPEIKDFYLPRRLQKTSDKPTLEWMLPTCIQQTGRDGYGVGWTILKAENDAKYLIDPVCFRLLTQDDKTLFLNSPPITREAGREHDYYRLEISLLDVARYMAARGYDIGRIPELLKMQSGVFFEDQEPQKKLMDKIQIAPGVEVIVGHEEDMSYFDRKKLNQFISREQFDNSVRLYQAAVGQHAKPPSNYEQYQRAVGNHFFNDLKQQLAMTSAFLLYQDLRDQSRKVIDAKATHIKKPKAINPDRRKKLRG